MSEFENQNQESEVNQSTEQPQQPQQESPVQQQAPIVGGKSSTGMDENIAALLAYLFGPVSAIIFIILEKESKFVKFHAFQSLFYGVAMFVISIIIMIAGIVPIVGFFIGILGFFVNIGFLVLYVVLLVKAYQNEMFKLPIIGDLAEKQVN